MLMYFHMQRGQKLKAVHIPVGVRGGWSRFSTVDGRVLTLDPLP